MRFRSLFLTCSVFYLSSCATILTSEGSKINVSDDVRPPFSCEFLGKVEGASTPIFTPTGSAINSLLNKAGELGATDVFITSQSPTTLSGASATGEAYKCDPVNDKSTADLINLCDGNNAQACIALSAQLFFKPTFHDWMESLNALNKACKLHLDRACWLEKQIQEKIKVQYGINSPNPLQQGLNFLKGCDANNDAKDCFELALLSQKYNYKQDAYKYSQISCARGFKKGCALITMLQADKQMDQQALQEQQRLALQARAINSQMQFQQGLIDEMRARDFANALQNMISPPTQ
jgi:hypothetical protein